MKRRNFLKAIAALPALFVPGLIAIKKQEGKITPIVTDKWEFGEIARDQTPRNSHIEMDWRIHPHCLCDIQNIKNKSDQIADKIIKENCSEMLKTIGVNLS